MKHYFLALAIIISGFLSADVQGASLFGKVIEVNSGDVLTISNLNRPVRVKLLGVDAPEMNQAFGDVAKKHLADLILDKSVLVEYSGIASDSSLTGRVLLNDADIGAQMIRDGAAWFDTNTNRLSGPDRDVYQQSEQAARNERRGLWQQENPVAPWEFVRNEALRRNPPVASLKSIAPEAQPAPKRPVAELTNFTLMTAGIAAAPPAPVAGPQMALLAGGPSRGNWRLLRPPGANFSALVPENGKLTEAPVPEGESHFFIGRDGSSAYVVSWVTAPSMGETDKDAIPTTLEVFLKAVGIFHIGTAGVGPPMTFVCELQNETSISQGGFTGSEYDLRSCTVPARARVFTRMVGDQRQMYIAVVFYGEEDENVSRFIKSFTISAPQKSKSRSR